MKKRNACSDGYICSVPERGRGEHYYSAVQHNILFLTADDDQTGSGLCGWHDGLQAFLLLDCQQQPSFDNTSRRSPKMDLHRLLRAGNLLSLGPRTACCASIVSVT